MGNDREGGRKINELSSAGQLKCEGGGIGGTGERLNLLLESWRSVMTGLNTE